MKALLIFASLFLVAGLVAQTPPPPPRPKLLVSPELADGKATFRYRASQAKEVILRGQWSKEPIPMARDSEGIWTATVAPAPAGVWEYSYSVDGLSVLDPVNPSFKPQRELGKSILHVPSDPPAPWDWQNVPHGTVHHHTYLSKGQGTLREMWVYTPPGYEGGTEDRYPVLVLQHGSGDNQRTWVEHGKAHWILDNLIAEGKAKPMVMVMISGHPAVRPAAEDAATRQLVAEAFRKELMQDALPLAESLYRVATDGAHRAIAGLSMGGGQALTVGLGNLERFGWIGAFSAGGMAPEAMEKFLAHPETAHARLRLLWIACGKDDRLLQRNEEFVAALKEKSVGYEWHITAGDHSWPVWRGYLAEFAPRLFQPPEKKGK